MQNLFPIAVVLSFAFAFVFQVGTLWSSDHGCQHCGCSNGCQKVCRLVCEEKKVEVVCWGIQSEDVCLPCPSEPGCTHCEPVCEKDPNGKVCTAPKKFVWTEWIPNCKAKLYTKNKLMKKTVTKTVPSYKWVVEDLCPKCTEEAPRPKVNDQAEIPAPPKVNAIVIR